MWFIAFANFQMKLILVLLLVIVVVVVIVTGINVFNESKTFLNREGKICKFFSEMHSGGYDLGPLPPPPFFGEFSKNLVSLD
jgi:hypothetical protein